MNSRMIFFEPGNSSSSSVSTSSSSIFVMAFRNEPFVLRNGIS